MADPTNTVPQTVHSAGTDPSFAGALVALMHALQSSFAPKALTQRGPMLDQQIAGGVPAPAAAQGPIGNPQPPGGLGNQSPGLGQSF
jgi:hypothetical protein